MEDERVENRTCPRSRVIIRAEVRLKCGVIVDGAALDLSLRGLLLETERTLPLDCSVKVTLVRDGGACEQRIDCQGTVTRLDPRGVAILFDEMGAENTARLQHLLALDNGAGEAPELAATFAAEYY